MVCGILLSTISIIAKSGGKRTMQSTNSNIHRSIERIRQALAEFNSNLELVQENWLAEDLAVWIDSWIDFYDKAPDIVRKTHILSLLAEDIEQCLQNEKAQHEEDWQDEPVSDQNDTDLAPVLTRLAKIEKRLRSKSC